MRVICIDDSKQSSDACCVKKGNTYTVIDIRHLANDTTVEGNYRCLAGNYYVLAECDNNVGFFESMFIKINEDQQDETTFERNYNVDWFDEIFIQPLKKSQP